MNKHVSHISARLSLRTPQLRSLEILDRVTEISPQATRTSVEDTLRLISTDFPTVTDFERDFPSLCFALATGVGKTRLMGAFITYLHLARGMNNFFVMAPNLTIYNKLIADFTPGTPKYVFTGISEFAVDPPVIITGENYDRGAGVKRDVLPGFEKVVHINIFNIAKINSEVRSEARGGLPPRIKRLSEYLGESYFEYLAGLPDLVLIMDESHRYRADAGVRAINELKPVLGLELTATPFIEGARGRTEWFKNIIFNYPLASAMQDGYVKEPAVITQKNFIRERFSAPEIEKIKLEDGIRLHEDVKVRLETYARETGRKIVKPFMLVIARDTTHAGELLSHIQSEAFFEGRYRGKAIQVDSSTRSGTEGEEVIERLLQVENPDEPTEIVIHVDMLKEGWDVTNLYTIVPLRAANARTLIEQSIGRGLRLPYGTRTGVEAVDRLNIVAHDRFQEIVDESNRPDSLIRLKVLELDAPGEQTRLESVVVRPVVTSRLFGDPVSQGHISSSETAIPSIQPAFTNSTEQDVAQKAFNVISQLQGLRSTSSLLEPSVQEQVVARVLEELTPRQPELSGLLESVDVASVVGKTAAIMVNGTIDIPRILIVPKGEVTSGFHTFNLDPSSVHYPPVNRDILIQHLRTSTQETLAFAGTRQGELRPEDYLVRGLMDFDDVSYDQHSDLLYKLASEMVAHLRSYLRDEADVMNVLQYYQTPLSELIHSQMQSHHWEKTAGYDVVIKTGSIVLKEQAFTATAGRAPQNFRNRPDDLRKIDQLIFVGFNRCLYGEQKFHSDTERKLAIILERDSLKWFRPARGQFHLNYRWEHSDHEYQPDFVAETDSVIYMIETKDRNELLDGQVQAKRDAAVLWCRHAGDHALGNGGKDWKYLLIPHDIVSESMSLDGLAAEFVQRDA